MDWSVFFGCLGVLFLGCFVQGAVGFGMGVVAGPLILLLEPQLMPSVIVFIGTCLSFIIMFQYRDSLSLRELFFAFLGRIPGTFAAGYLLFIISKSQLSLLLGVSVLIVVLLSVTSLKLKPTRLSLFIGGFISGVMGTATGIGGPPVALLLQNEQPERLRANLAGYFAITGLLSLVILHFSGYFSYSQFKYSLLMLPAPFLATYLAFKVRHRIRAEVVRYAVLVLCSLSAITALYQGLH